jgi:hypothetical protein
MAEKLISSIEDIEAHLDAEQSGRRFDSSLGGSELGNPGHWWDSIAADQKHLVED